MVYLHQVLDAQLLSSLVALDLLSIKVGPTLQDIGPAETKTFEGKLTKYKKYDAFPCMSSSFYKLEFHGKFWRSEGHIQGSPKFSTGQHEQDHCYNKIPGGTFYSVIHQH